MSSSSSHETAMNARNLASSPSKMVHLTSGGSAGTLLEGQTQPPSLPTGNVHCSINQQSGNAGAGLAPIMEIREMNSYCNSCMTVGADKYWNHHPHANVPRHTAVYPQMFYTPPPPPPPHVPPQPANYTTSSGGGVPTGAPSNEWSCPPSTADSYSHFIYSQYPPPPPAPPQHHDYNNFLSMSTSCYESDMMMMSTVPGTSSQVQNSCDPSAPPQSIMNSFMYPTPLPPPPQLPSYENAINVTTTSSLVQPQNIPVKMPKTESFQKQAVTPAQLSTSTSEDSTDESDDDDDEESSHIISIEDDDNDRITEDEIMPSPATGISSLSAFCVLCRGPASLLPVLPTNAPSPQLSRILDNIDDDELDISVCSGDIEIGGIEDEMIQQATEQQQQQRVSLQRLSQLVGVPVIELLPRDVGGDESENTNQDQALLCSKCQKLVGMAESLEKQLSSVLGTLRQVCSLEDCIVAEKSFKVSSARVNSVAVQTEVYDLNHETDDIIQVRRCNNDKSSSIPCQKQSNNSCPSDGVQGFENGQDNIIPLNQYLYLCHECGRRFNCRRNLGKHLKRHHHHDSPDEKSNKLPICRRENCGKIFLDKTALEIHLRTHTSEKPYFCVTCFKLFTTKSNLAAHLKSNVCQEKLEQFPPINSKPPSSRESDDIDEIVNSTTFHCENCGLTFRTESRFQRHISNKAACNKSKLLQCDICSKPFAKRSELQAHRVVHTKEKSFQCDICGMAFSTRGNQRVHQRTHFNQKRFKCQQCDKAFTRNQTLQIHIANAHKKE